MRTLYLLLIILFVGPLGHSAEGRFFTEKSADFQTVRADLRSILEQARWKDGQIQFRVKNQTRGTNKVSIQCRGTKFHLNVSSSPEEWAPTFYYGLQKLGFLFPHPRIQISPKGSQARQACGKTFVWKPSIRYRGFHLHTQHPSEWVAGFLGKEKAIATDMIRWLARNGQNLLQVVLLKTIPEGTDQHLVQLFDLANRLGIYTGLSISFSFEQQRSYTLFRRHEVALSFLGLNLSQRLSQRLQFFIDQFPGDFVTFEIGTSEFTKTKSTETLRWLNTAQRVLEANGRQIFVKIHASSNQKDDKGANFNFLPERANSSVGVLPHTVMFYSLSDTYTPAYGRKNFADMKDFTNRNNGKRPVLYFPETSYFVAFDIDVPILLTDYLMARTDDMKYLVDQRIPGQLNFSTGQELGYWLFDWHVALSANRDYHDDPLIALKLLGEDTKIWKKILEFQNTYFKERQLITAISSSTLLDEVPFFHSPHERIPITQLSSKVATSTKQIELLEEAISNRPDISGVKNTELKLMLQTTWLRLEHAKFIRLAALSGNPEDRAAHLLSAKNIRLSASGHMENIRQFHSRYPRAKIFEEFDNPTSYGFGYGWPAATLHFWQREEAMIEEQSFYPWFRNIYSPVRFVF